MFLKSCVQRFTLKVYKLFHYNFGLLPFFRFRL